MWRIGRVLAVFTFAWSLLLTVPAAAEPVPSPEPSAAVVVAQQAPPGPDLEKDSKPVDRQRVAIGTAGIALILLVLLSRKLRKKPVLYIQWKRKG